MKQMVMVLDDDKQKRTDLLKHLRRADYEVSCAATVEEANKFIKSEKIDFAIIDLKIDYSSGYSGVKVIENLKKMQPWAQIIILSAYSADFEDNKIRELPVSEFISKKASDNYINDTIEALQKLKKGKFDKKCFVIMPFSKTQSCTEEEWNDIFDNMIKPSVENSRSNYRCLRADILIGNIIKHILDNLNKADVVLADLTDRNPNVFYELGVRHALRNGTILITQNIDDVPFDLRQYSVIKYSWKTRKGKDDFMDKVNKVLAVIENDPDGKNTASPIKEYLSFDGQH